VANDRFPGETFCPAITGDGLHHRQSSALSLRQREKSEQVSPGKLSTQYGYGIDTNANRRIGHDPPQAHRTRRNIPAATSATARDSPSNSESV